MISGVHLRCWGHRIVSLGFGVPIRKASLTRIHLQVRSALLFTLLNSTNRTSPLCLFCYGVIGNSPEVGHHLFQSLCPPRQKDPSLTEKSCSFKIRVDIKAVLIAIQSFLLWSPEQGPFKVGCVCKRQASSRVSPALPPQLTRQVRRVGARRGEVGRRWELSNDLL